MAPGSGGRARRDATVPRGCAARARSPQPVARERLPEAPRRVPRDRPDADAVPRAARQLLHRSVGRRLSVHHLLEADRPAARHRHAARADLERAPRPRRSRARSGRGSARSAGPRARRIRASSATRSPVRRRRRAGPIAAREQPRRRRSSRDERHLLRRRRRPGRASTGRSTHHVAADVSVVIAAKQEAPSIGARHRSHAPLRQRDRRRRRPLDRRHRRGRRAERRPSAGRRRPRQRARRSAAPSRTSARR